MGFKQDCELNMRVVLLPNASPPKMGVGHVRFVTNFEPWQESLGKCLAVTDMYLGPWLQLVRSPYLGERGIRLRGYFLYERVYDK